MKLINNTTEITTENEERVNLLIYTSFTFFTTKLIGTVGIEHITIKLH